MTNESEQPTPPQPGVPARRELSEADQKNWAMAAHLSALIAFVGVPSLVGPLVVWLMKKDESPFIASHSRDALNFNISALIYVVVGSLLFGVIGVLTLGIGFLLAIPAAIIGFIVWLVLVIQASMAASNGREYKYPFTINLIS